MPNSRAFEIGYADADYGFTHWSNNSSYTSKDEWVARMRIACEKCKDKDYAAGVTKRLDEYERTKN